MVALDGWHHHWTIHQPHSLTFDLQKIIDRSHQASISIPVEVPSDCRQTVNTSHNLHHLFSNRP
jgi:hypothetical protein